MEMAADSSTAMAMALALYGGSSSLPFHQMLSFQSTPPDSIPARFLPPNAAAMLAPSSSSSSAPPLHEYKFVTGSPADWTAHELAVLKEGLLRYAHEPNIIKYIKIAAMLRTRTIRDVALRCWLTSGKESGIKKPDEFYVGRTIMDLKDKMVASAVGSNIQFVPPNNTVPFSISVYHPGQNSLIHKEVPVLDSAVQHLLEENNELLSRIAENIETFKMVENMDLFLRMNDNIRTVLKSQGNPLVFCACRSSPHIKDKAVRMSETPGVMGQMPPLPVPVNECSLNSILQMDRMVGAYGVSSNSL